ncbi:MAG: cytochrome C [Halobacteriovorax sp.]|nr:cytochrome C [Halobacteriovorax sp.]|tara:strand:+ start:29726 stop:30031 length:306 start_codon:yes stop_codon:yes gene_type:complete
MKVFALLMTVTVLVLASRAQAADAARGANLYKTCVECHGQNGEGMASQEAPRIAGQYDWYILSSLQAFKKKERNNPKMYPFIKNLSDQDFEDLAAHVSRLK